MKKLYLLLFFIAGSCSLQAQSYANEWIAFGAQSQYSLQQYFKIGVWKEGIYRITYNDLLGVNVPLTFINPKEMQLFRNGREQYMYLSDDTATVWRSDMYFEFYGRRNDGTFDSQMYDTDTSQVNKKYSLVNDTAAYFLTFPPATGGGSNGKRMINETDVNFAAYPQAAFVWRDVYMDFGQGYYNAGYQNQDGLTDNSYISGETFSSPRFVFENGGGGTFTNGVPTPNVYTGGPSAMLETVILGSNNSGAIPNHNYTLTFNNIQYINDFLNGYEWRRYNITVPATVLNQGTSTLTAQALSIGGPPNSLSMPYISMRYPHLNSFSGESGPHKFIVEGNNSFGKAYLNLSNTSTGPGAPVLYAINGDTVRRVTVVQGGTLEMLVPAGAEQYCFLTSDGSSYTTGNFTFSNVNNDPTNFAKFINYNYQGLLCDYILISHPSLRTEADNYRIYRGSPAGGSRKVIHAEVQQLYDQFAYGINGHPLSIRNFCKFLIAHQPTPPRDLFLLGKSISSGERSHDSPLDLVPTYGYPPSDNMFTAGLIDTTGFSIAIPTGRLAARTPYDADIYLEKVEAYESQQKAPWMKKVLHFCGGGDKQESDYLCGILDMYRQTIEDTLFGAKVYTFSKHSTDPISNISSLALKDLINNGVSIMTFFAHAAGSSFDISTDAPSTYQNKDKYPIIIANSCYIGDIHTPYILASEEFVILKDKGAIAFLAAPNQGYINFLASYSENLYKNIAYQNYGKSLASSIKNTVDSVMALNPNNFYFKSTCMGMTLHGDPAIVPYSFDKPDLVIDEISLFTNPPVVKVEEDTFQLKIYVRNEGRAVNTPFNVEIVRTYPDGTDTVIIRPMAYVSYADTMTVTLRTAPEHGSGNNSIRVKADNYNQVDELPNENNNEHTLIVNIQSSDIFPVFPYKYAIIPNNSVILKATTSDPFAPLRIYRFEVDTTDDFTNPLLINDIAHTGGVVNWALPFTLDSNRVYYWRVADKDILSNPNLHKWNESSFIYKPGKTGWSQAHFYQFKNDERKNIIYDRPNRKFDFVQTQSTLLAQNTMYPFGGPTHPVQYLIDNAIADYGVCSGQPSIYIAVIDSISLKPWETLFGNNGGYYFNNLNTAYYCHARPDKYFVFTNDSVSLEHMKDMINQVPCGNFILAYSMFRNDNSLWPADVKLAFNNLGATAINTLQDYQPWIFFGKKCDLSMSQEVSGDSLNPDISLTALMGGNWSKGYLTSELIGPATKWTGLHWAQHKLEPGASKDSMLLKLIAIDKFGNATDIIPYIPLTLPDINYLDTVVDANIFPYLRFDIYLQDDSLRSPPQMDRWQIYYDQAPEGAMNPSKFFSFYKNPLQEGDTAMLTVAFENISNIDFADSMLVDYYLYDQTHQRVNLGSPNYKKLKAGEVDTFKVKFSTLGKRNVNTLWVEANPHNDQPEQYHYNNYAQLAFEVNRDITNPVLDVTFDGVHILNGDIISSKPIILMQLVDENKFLALNDTSHWRVFIEDPDGAKKQLFFETTPGFTADHTKMKWTPAQLPKNSFKIEYNPELLKDGVYELTIDASSDESGNESGANSYKITFEVINHSSITNVVNYPNPFSSSTRFVFTLTGSEVPDYFKIQIMTVTGKIVREIMREELGNIHIGRNVTDYAWNGKDEFGDQLANGIYLYRVITSINGSSIEQRGTEADKYFKKGYGKMYLLR